MDQRTLPSLITLTATARKLDTTPDRLRRKIQANVLTPVAMNSSGAPMFDATKLDEYRAALAKPEGQ